MTSYLDPLNPLPHVLLLLLLQHQLNKQLLQLLIAVVDAQLFKAVCVCVVRAYVCVCTHACRQVG